ncbi:hypothetical protein PODOV005v1_20004 [Vibrio phage PS32B.2]|nr:hypothetical protein PODOV005v1_20004 [Vibrio phage PS32B.2]QZI86300.1 hypothetical protein PODOV028v1_10009 [Vibrio phage PS32B.3]QZI86395.1 hypothetical protein PODOV029v1_30002 [Vibrio phage PS35B.1]QZI86455.1 hypothetical protein PODOV027v1_10046 [Vibrio phage PS35B.3]QZI92189.1 hypothetical protein PODOV026v1_p0016 [Vibrio phage PS32B.1]QZI92294.1 hypothetical protein PODOV004v1_p0059 [Vibrio phage PS32B.11]QZI92313.1 hypothetical protein PODOV025v1_p0016 [Vibrio phage PS32B.6]
MKLNITLELIDDDGNLTAKSGGYITEVEKRSVDELVPMIAQNLHVSLVEVLPNCDKTLH